MIPRERAILIAATIATAVTRLLAMSKTLWDWDEALFVLALRDFDVTLHQPHPPGFPLYVLSAKLFQLLGVPEFRALQTINLIAAVAIVPVAYLLARTLRFSFATSLYSALFLAFFPNVWFFGGTAFSDVPSMVLVMLAAALFLRGQPLAGAIVLGIAIGFRPQNALVGAVPLLLSAARVRAAAISGAIAAVSYAAAALLSGGFARYASAVAAHQHYIATHDSIGASTRPPLRYLIDDFFFWPFRAPAINLVIALLVGVSVIAAVLRPRFGRWFVIGTFGPLAVLSFLMLDWLSASRFSIGYMPLFAILAADGLSIAAGREQGIGAAAIVVAMFGWTAPVLREVRNAPSPPVAAFMSVPPSAKLFVTGALVPHARALLPARAFQAIDESAVPVSILQQRDAIVVREGAGEDRRPRGRLATIARDRYFHVQAIPMAQYISLAGNSLMLASADGIGRFSIQLRGSNPVTIRFNGRALDRFTPNGATRTYRVPSRFGTNRVTIEGEAEVVSAGWSEAARL